MGIEGTYVAALGYVTVAAGMRLRDAGVKGQVAALDDLCVRRGWTLAALVHEVEVAGRRPVRPALTYAIERMRTDDIRCLVVTDLGALCRSVAGLTKILDALDRVGGRLVSLEPPIDTGTEAGRDAARVLVAVADWEHRLAADRSRKALAEARARGALQPAIPPDLKRQIARMRGAGMTLQAIVNELNDAGIPTVRGGAEWRVSSVQTAIGYKRPLRT